MKTTTRFVDYSPEQLRAMIVTVGDFFEVFEECATKLKEIKEKKVKVVEDTSRPNEIYINPKIKVDYLRTKDTEMPVHLIIEKYDEWFDELYRLTIVNEPWLGHSKVFDHVAGVLAVCATFQGILEEAKQGMKPEPPKPGSA